MNVFKRFTTIAITTLLIAGLSNCSGTYPVSTSIQYSNPAWAPPYYAGVRYYYLPDIETYYDLQNNDFAYMNNGQWMFSASLPAMYSNYNLYNGFSVSLSNNVYQPWMHHQHYTANYPRYYYLHKYQGNQQAGIRGFNENIRQPVFTNSENKNRLKEINTDQQNNHINIIRPVAPTRPAQNPIFRGNNIGQPVKVRPYMRQRRDIKNDKQKNNNGIVLPNKQLK